MFIVYKTTNLINGKIYIGVHDNGDKEGFDGYLGSGTLILKAIKKYGKENFIRETLHTCEDIEIAFLLESELVTEEFFERMDTYNLMVGGKATIVVGKHSRKYKSGIFSDDYTDEMRSEHGKKTFSTIPSEKRYIYSQKGGKKTLENKSGIFSDEYINNLDDEKKYNLSSIGGKKAFEYKLGIFSDDYTSEMKANNCRLKNIGSVYYNDGAKNYQYTKKQQETLSITEFMKNNPEYVLGRCRVNKQTELNN